MQGQQPVPPVKSMAAGGEPGEQGLLRAQMPEAVRIQGALAAERVLDEAAAERARPGLLSPARVQRRARARERTRTEPLLAQPELQVLAVDPQLLAEPEAARVEVRSF
jgi:hypothetical protein